jgi:hypothetical protein
MDISGQRPILIIVIVIVIVVRGEGWHGGNSHCPSPLDRPCPGLVHCAHGTQPPLAAARCRAHAAYYIGRIVVVFGIRSKGGGLFFQSTLLFLFSSPLSHSTCILPARRPEVGGVLSGRGGGGAGEELGASDNTSIGVFFGALSPPSTSFSLSWIKKGHPESFLLPPPLTMTAGHDDNLFPNPNDPPLPPVHVVIVVVVVIVVRQQQVVRPWTCPVEELAHKGIVQAAIECKHRSQQNAPYQ